MCKYMTVMEYPNICQTHFFSLIGACYIEEVCSGLSLCICYGVTGQTFTLLCSLSLPYLVCQKRSKNSTTHIYRDHQKASNVCPAFELCFFLFVLLLLYYFWPFGLDYMHNRSAKERAIFYGSYRELLCGGKCLIAYKNVCDHNNTQNSHI